MPQVHLLADPHPPKGDGRSPLARDVLLVESLQAAIEADGLSSPLLDSPPGRPLRLCEPWRSVGCLSSEQT